MAQPKKRDLEPWGGYASVPENNPQKYGLRVADKTFPMSRWREAILRFLFGIWSGKRQFWHNPTICFGDLRLTLRTRDSRTPDKDDRFVIEGEAPDNECTGACGYYSLDVGVRTGYPAVMDALARFAKDPCLARVDLRLDLATTLTLFQKERRGEYGCYVFRSDP